jgi:hypothetical protein
MYVREQKCLYQGTSLETPNETDYAEPRSIWKDNSIIDLNETGEGVWAGFIWPRRGATVVLL